MALIDFECEKCGNKFFELVKPEEADKIKCPKCGSNAKKVYKGKFYGKSSGGSCSGSCGSCSGCH